MFLNFDVRKINLGKYVVETERYILVIMIQQTFVTEVCWKIKSKM